MSEEIEYEEFEVEKVGIEHIGLEFCLPDSRQWYKIVGVGCREVFYPIGVLSDVYRYSPPIRLRRPKPMQKVALGAYRRVGGRWQTTCMLYSSLEDVEINASGWDEYHWPVKFDENGFAELPE